MFKTFPEFSKLTLKDKDEYESFVKDLPPVSDINFASIMVWWDTIGSLMVSLLNDNLVISYWLPGDDKHSGLSLIGTNNVDESICAIFDYLRERGEEPRLVNVPDFVVDGMRYPELFKFKVGRGDDEYLIRLSRFAQLESMPSYMRIRTRKFIRQFGQSDLQVKRLDMRSIVTRQHLLEVTGAWPLKGINNINKLERSALPVAISRAMALDVQGVGLYIDGMLQAYCLYLPTNDSDYATLSHSRVNYDIPRIFDYIVHAFCEHLANEGYKFVNLHADNDSQKMRALKIALKPDHFFHKYTIEPA
jgi:hypothetical protein